MKGKGDYKPTDHRPGEKAEILKSETLKGGLGESRKSADKELS
jgi:hypothetical protein